MPPRVRLRLSRGSPLARSTKSLHQCCPYATAATAAATTPAPSIEQMIPPQARVQRHQTQQPPSYRRPDLRTSQLIRTYVSLLETTPIILLFQHSNILVSEWDAIRRELRRALVKVDETMAAEGKSAEEIVGGEVRLQVVRMKMFEQALRIEEFYRKPLLAAAPPPPPPPVPDTSALDVEIPSEMRTTRVPSYPEETPIHALSTSAYEAVKHKRGQHVLSPLLTGSIALLTLPSISPAHLKCALSMLSPSPPTFAAPTRRANPGYWDPAVQSGIKKLILLGGRVEGRIMDMDGARWVGGLAGGMDTLRGGLVHALQGAGQGVVGALEGAGRSLWFTVEGRRRMLEEEANPKMEVEDGLEKEKEKGEE